MLRVHKLWKCVVERKCNCWCFLRRFWTPDEMHFDISLEGFMDRNLHNIKHLSNVCGVVYKWVNSPLHKNATRKANWNVNQSRKEACLFVLHIFLAFFHLIFAFAAVDEDVKSFFSTGWSKQFNVRHKKILSTVSKKLSI